MGEALLVRKGGSKGKKVLITEIITVTQEYTPKVGTLDVLLFGGGGGGGVESSYCKAGGGGGGHMARGTLKVDTNTTYTITIGSGGEHSYNGGSTSFGTLLSANGGNAGKKQAIILLQDVTEVMAVAAAAVGDKM